MKKEVNGLYLVVIISLFGLICIPNISANVFSDFYNWYEDIFVIGED